MEEFKVSSFSELHEVFSRYRKNNQWLFRGHSNPEWALIPKAGRKPYVDSDDLIFFESWKRRAVEFVSYVPKSDWDWLAIAQHHGLATRLLDWTFNPLVGTYFAVAEEAESDAVVFAYMTRWSVEPDKYNPKEVRGVIRFKPKGIAQRITRQSGIFTIHNPPTLPLDQSLESQEKLEKIIIDKTYRKNLLFELSHYGINRLSLFPDLDGLSGHINWYMASKVYWAEHEQSDELVHPNIDAAQALGEA